MTHQLYQANIRPYAWPLADPDQPAFIFPHIQQQQQDAQQLISMYAAVQDPQVAPPLTISRKRWLSPSQGTQQVAKKHTSALQKAQKAVTAAWFGIKPFTSCKSVRTDTQGQSQTMTPEVLQLVAHLIQKGPDALCAGKPVVAISPAGPSAVMSTAKPTCSTSTTVQPWLKTATVTTTEPLFVISIEDDEPMLTLNVTTTTASILDTAMMEEEESLRMKQICMVQELVDKLLPRVQIRTRPTRKDCNAHLRTRCSHQ